MLQIDNFGGSAGGEAGHMVSLDDGNVTISGAGTITALTVSLADFDGTDLYDHLEVVPFAGITLEGIAGGGTRILYAGTAIGAVDGTSTDAQLTVNFEGASVAAVEAVIKALRYTNTSSATSTAEVRTIRIQLDYWNDVEEVDGTTTAQTEVLIRPDHATVLTATSGTVTGTSGDDVFVVSSSAIPADAGLTGGSGSDALHFVGGGSLHLSNFSNFSGVEALRGSAEVDNFFIQGRHLLGLSEIAGGSGEETQDSISLTGNYFDFRGVTLTGIDAIQFMAGTSPVFVFDSGNIDAIFVPEGQGLRCLINLGTNASNATFRLSTPSASLSNDQIGALMAAGFANVSDSTTVPSADAPTATGLHGDRISVASGATAPLDIGQPFAVSYDEVIRGVRVEMADAASDDLLGIQASDGIVLPDGLQQGGTVQIGNALGILTTVQAHRIEVTFLENGNAASAAALVKAMTYTRPAGATFAARDVNVTVKDDFDRTVMSTVTVFDAPLENRPPTDVKLNGLTTVAVAENTAFAATLSATDPDGHPLTFTFDTGTAGGGNAGGIFVIDNVTRQLKLAPGKSLDFETAKSFTVHVKAADNKGGISATQALTIHVTDVVETPTDLVLVGTSRADRLTGEAGHDRVAGKAGKDVLTGAAGKDVFVFDTKPDRKTNLDTITDYSAADDTIWLDNKYFKKLGKGSPSKPGALNKKFFKVADKAKDGNDYLVYNKKTGILSYDADGSGAAKAVEIAKLSKNLKMTAADVFII